MPIIRVIKDKENPYVMLNKEFIESPELSWKEKGLLAYLLSKPDNWKVYLKQLIKASQNGKESTASAILGLVQKGYIERTQKTKKSGQFSGYDYTVYESPGRETRRGLPDAENPETENPTLINNNKTNKQKNNKETLILESMFSEFWSQYPRKDNKRVAMQRFKASYKDYSPKDQFFNDFARALRLYLQYCELSGITKDDYMKGGRRFFEEWEAHKDQKMPEGVEVEYIEGPDGETKKVIRKNGRIINGKN